MAAFTDLDVAPAYGVAEASRYLRLPPEKVKRWAAALRLNEASLFPLSFVDLLELHVLKSIRLTYAVPLQRIRRALGTLAQHFPAPFPLLNRQFATDGVDLLLHEQDSIINLSRFGQESIQSVVETYVQRIELGPQFARLYPFVKSDASEEPRNVVITPHIGFGRPTIAGTGVSTEVVADRFRARESLAALSAEYELPLGVLEEAIRWEMNRADAA